MGLSPYLLSLSLAACFNGNFQQAYLLSILNQPYLEIQQVTTILLLLKSLNYS